MRMDLFFLTNHGKSFHIEIGYFDTVLEIKKKIHKEQAIPISKQTLFFNDNILNDDLNVHHSQIIDRSLIHILITSDTDNFPSPLLIRWLLLKKEESELAAAERNLYDEMQRLKEIFREWERARIRHSVFTANLPYPNMNMGGGSDDGKLRVFVLNGAEKNPMEMSAAENVSELREKLQKMKVKVPEGGYFFVYKNNVMDEDRSLSSHHVDQGDSIEIISAYFL